MRRWVPGMLAAVLLLMISLPVGAAEKPPFSVSLTKTQGAAGGPLGLTLSYDGAQGPLGAFVLWVEYDPQVLTCEPPVFDRSLREGYLFTAGPEEGRLAAVYTQKSAELAFTGSERMLFWRFQVKEDAPAGSTALRVRAGQVLSPEGESLCPDGEETVAYEVLAPPSGDASLLALAPDEGRLDQDFSPEQLRYTMSVPYTVKSLTFTAQPAPGATCRVNRKNLEAGGSETEFKITVIAEDGETRQTYQVDVYREPKEPPSGEALLTALTPKEGQLEQEFSPERLHYTMRVPYSVKSVSFTAVPAEGASCKVDRRDLEEAGSTTTFAITVTAADGKTTEIYRVDVYREEKDPALMDASLRSLVPETGELEPPFSPEELEYVMTVPFSIKSMSFTAEPAEGAACKVNRKNLGAGGSDTEFKLTVTAADGETKQVYRVLVHRQEQVKASATAAPSGTAAAVKTSKPTATPAPTKTPKPSASPSPTKTPKPSPSGIPVPVEAEEDPEPPAESSPPPETILLPEGLEPEPGPGPGLIAASLGLGAGAVLLSGAIVRLLEKRRGPKE